MGAELEISFFALIERATAVALFFVYSLHAVCVVVDCGVHATPVVSLLTEVFTPCRDGRLSLPLRANVRVGPPAMS